jgi:MFS family permease
MSDARFGIRSPRVVLALLTALNLLNYLDRFVLSAVLKKVQEDLSMTKFVAGLLATIFLIGYFATSPIFGTLADHGPRGRRSKLIALGIAIWSLATIGSGLVQSTGALWVCRAFVGIGEASYATIAPTIIDDIAPTNRKARWLAIFYTAIPVGSALGYIVGGAVETATHSWRMAFYVAGAPGLVLAALCLLIVEPERRTERKRPDILGSTRSLVAILPYRLTVLGYSAYSFAMGGFAYWAPAYLSMQYGLEEGKAASTFGGITVLSGILGTLLGGALGDRWLGKKTDDTSATSAALRVCALSAGLGAPLALFAILAPSATAFFALVFPCQVALFLSSGPVNVATLRSVPAGLRASAMALSIFAIHAFGDLWSPMLIGLAGDHMPMAWAMLAGPLVFAIAAFIWWRGARLMPSRG